jgi:Ca2+-binding EF-hand superfamily protein
MSDQVSADVFKAMDKDGDGKISAIEYLAACKRGEEKCTEDFKWFDRNKDGSVTLPEYEGKVKK